MKLPPLLDQIPAPRRSSALPRIGRPSGRSTILILGVALMLSALFSRPPQAVASDKGTKPMSANQNCSLSPVAQSRCVIAAILDDIGETYAPTGGGGIRSITQEATRVYTVAISQEERVDLITYEVSVSEDGAVSILSRKTGTKSFDR